MMVASIRSTLTLIVPPLLYSTELPDAEQLNTLTEVVFIISKKAFTPWLKEPELVMLFCA